ncbi:hypothetical protein [Anaerobium acetethylicum]|uniref:Uncharacterized protein n=1 Tax=Anaerobium acetethylicum TaxID=1619234 RepID=A0A1D3TWM6_9FIRM|nr:hypothetical protein [Anaerobium acetethylicum]SCP98633.1 hypothetical protein SAMN05421730_102347 [Anaerobium acetethylicum]
MSLKGIKETVGLVDAHFQNLSKEEREFIFQFAFQTDDTELIGLLVQELAATDKDSEEIIRKYEAICDEKPEWIRRVENLLVALEMYRIEEEKAVNRLAAILSAYGMDVTEEEIRGMDTGDIKDRVKKEVIIDRKEAGRN